MPKNSRLQKIFIFLLILIGLVPIVYFTTVEVGLAQTNDNPTDSTAVFDPIGRYVDNLAFGVEEKLYFDINYGFINAGTATLEVQRLIEYENRPCYQVVSTANSNKFFSSFFNVDDRIESLIDAVGFFSWRFEKNLKEGSYRSNRMYTFDQTNHTASYNDSIYTVTPYVQDAISMFYYTRTLDLETGKSYMIDNFVDGKLFTTEVKVVKRETVEVEAGTFDCIVVEPLLTSAGVFKHEGSLKVWLTDDRLKMPVMMKSKVLVGSITAELSNFELGEMVEF